MFQGVRDRVQGESCVTGLLGAFTGVWFSFVASGFIPCDCESFLLKAKRLQDNCNHETLKRCVVFPLGCKVVICRRLPAMVALQEWAEMLRK